MYLLIGTVSQVTSVANGPVDLFFLTSRHNQFQILESHIYHVTRFGYVLSGKPFKMNVVMKLNIY